MIPDSKTAYRQIMKATSIFGGTQVFSIIINIIRSKFIAMLLGPLGMGVAGLFTTTTGLIASMTNFGLDTIAVNYIGEAHGTGKAARISIILTVIRRLVWITGFLGFFITAAFSSLLSKLTFGNENYTSSFLMLSITLLFNHLNTGNTVLMQGTRQVRYLAKAGMLGSLIGLLTTIPLYYFFGFGGIIPAIILSVFMTFILNWYFAKKIILIPVTVTIRDTYEEGKRIFRTGFLISLSAVINISTSYIIRIFIGDSGGLAEVGLYNAGFTLLNTYVGLIFTAMATDYYPRLSAVSYCNEKSKVVINQQAEIAILIISPLIIVTMVFINLLLITLFSKTFIPLKGMILYASLGLLFKAATWAVGFVFLSKRSSKLFFFSELLSNVYLLILSILGYEYFGLTGLGMAFWISYVLSFAQVYLLANLNYQFYFTKTFHKILTLQFLLALGCFFVMSFLDSMLSYVFGLLFIFYSSYFSFRELDNRLNLKEIIFSLKKKYNNR
jgi:O-antigen/teichoic acid export membrane protein